MASGIQELKSGEVCIACPGCGAENLAAGSRLCLVCGKGIREGFQPLDAIKSSYRLQGRSLSAVSNAVPIRLFHPTDNGYADTAWACTVYSMVPYLGILFIPFAVGVGAVSYIANRQSADTVGGRRALFSIAVSLVILLIQIVLWWLLYLIPEIGL